ncbi:MAG: hypothetical protein LBC56_03220 [Oscillospiraceae bacterium]|jgi:hypothetical protein|nr:hypothetical protein [Oscillospiraceae bacterium]
MSTKKTGTKKALIQRKSVSRLALSALLRMVCSYFFSAVIFLAIASTENRTLWKLLQILSAGILVSFLYVLMWYDGDRDSNLVLFGHVDFDPLRGIKAGLLAALPAALSYPLLALAKATESNPLFTVYRIINLPFIGFMNLLASSAYIEDIDTRFMIAMAFVPAVYVIASAMGYLLGYKHFSVIKTIAFKNRREKN